MSHQPKGAVFISHASEDRAFVEREILEPLQRRGIRTWYARTSIATADEWQRTILDGLEQCDRFLVVLSPRSVESRWVKAEVKWAVENRWPRRLIPVLLESCNSRHLHMWLPQLQYVDFVRDAVEAREQLLRGLLCADQKFADADTVDPPTLRAAPAGVVPMPPLRLPLFHFGGVVPPDCFVGRDQQLREAERIIRGGQNFLLVGEHRDGKTSLCKMLIHRMMSQPANTVLAVYLNVQMWPDVSIETFLEHTILGLIGEIGRQVFHCKFSSLRDFDVAKAPPALRDDETFRGFLRVYQHARARTYSRGDQPTQPFRAEEFQDIHAELLEIIEAKGWRTCVVVYDEANRLTSDIPVERLVSHEEALTVPGRVSVYAATPAMAASFRRLRDTFAHQVLLKPFDRDEVKQLLSAYCCRAAGEVVELPVTSDAVDQIWKSTGGQPYRVQLLAGGSFSVAHDRGDAMVSANHVAAALELLRTDKPSEFARDGL